MILHMEQRHCRIKKEIQCKIQKNTLETFRSLSADPSEEQTFYWTFKLDHTYNKDVQPNTKIQQRLRCRIRNKQTTCSASVLQNGTIFTNGTQLHKCTAKDCATPITRIRAHLRQE